MTSLELEDWILLDLKLSKGTTAKELHSTYRGKLRDIESALERLCDRELAIAKNGIYSLTKKGRKSVMPGVRRIVKHDTFMQEVKGYSNK